MAGARMRASAFLFGLVLAACSSRTPITLSPHYTPPNSSTAQSQSAGRTLIDNGPVCLVHLSEVRDARPVPSSMGSIGPRVISSPDAVGWLRSALLSLDRDPRIQFVEDADRAQLKLHIELLKAYLITITDEKSANVVVRVRYERDEKVFDEQIERGRETSVNWGNSEEETQGSLDRAMAHLVDILDADIVAHCRTLGSPAAP